MLWLIAIARGQDRAGQAVLFGVGGAPRRLRLDKGRRKEVGEGAETFCHQ